jgi:hypothetical protein
MAFNPLKNRTLDTTNDQISSTTNQNNTNQNNNNVNNVNNNINNSNNNQEKLPNSQSSIEDANAAVMDALSDLDTDHFDSQPVGEEYVTSYSSTENLAYEGEKVSDLQETGLNTESLLEKSNTPVEKQKFNLPLLKTLSLALVLKNMGGIKLKDNLFSVFNSEISIKENKWYNKTLATGKIDAISLTKHLLALKNNPQLQTKENILNYEKNNDKMLFSTSCRLLNELKNTEPELIEEKNEILSGTANQNATNENANNPNSNPSSSDNNSPSVVTPVTNTNKKYVQRTEEEHKAYWKELTTQLNSISLVEVMEHIGANPNEDGQRGKWKIWATGDNVQITGQLWKSWKSGGGGGAISLLAYHLATVNGMDTRLEDQKKLARTMAIKELIKVFGDGDLSMVAGTDSGIVLKVPFAMPHVIDFKINQVRNYLHEKRSLPMWIIDKQIQAGYLFAGYPSDWRMHKNIKNPEKLTDDNVWATFLSTNGTSAEMRAIDRSDPLAKLLAKGSDKDMGGFGIKAEKNQEGTNDKTLSALEAAIDSMSYHAIYPHRIATSCMGVTYKLAVKNALLAFDRGYNFELAFDNDQAGYEAAIQFRDELTLEIGEEAYKEHIEQGRVKYFDLGLRCLEECAEKNKKFYLDVQDNPTGFEVVKLFQEQAMMRFGRERVKELIANETIKYLNVCPDFNLIVDIEKEVQNAVTKLNSGKPYYLRFKNIKEVFKDNLTEDEKKQSMEAVKREAFITGFKEAVGPQYEQWVQEGIIISNKDAIAKDWNEYLIHLKENNPEFKQSMQEQEKKYVHYSEEVEIKEKNSKKRGKKP